MDWLGTPHHHTYKLSKGARDILTGKISTSAISTDPPILRSITFARWIATLFKRNRKSGKYYIKI